MQLSQFSTYVLAFVIIAVIIGIGGTILTEIQSTQTTSSIPYNATESGLEGVETFGNWLPTIAVIIAAAVVIGIIVNYFRA